MSTLSNTTSSLPQDCVGRTIVRFDSGVNGAAEMNSGDQNAYDALEFDDGKVLVFRYCCGEHGDPLKMAWSLPSSLPSLGSLPEYVGQKDWGGLEQFHFGTARDEVNPRGDLDSDGSDNDEPELRRRWPAPHLCMESTAEAPAKKSRSRLHGRRQRQLQGLEALGALSLFKRRRVAWVFTQYQVVDDARRKSGRRLVRALPLYILRLIALYAEDGSLVARHNFLGSGWINDGTCEHVVGQTVSAVRARTEQDVGLPPMYKGDADEDVSIVELSNGILLYVCYGDSGIIENSFDGEAGMVSFESHCYVDLHQLREPSDAYAKLDAKERKNFAKPFWYRSDPTPTVEDTMLPFLNAKTVEELKPYTSVRRGKKPDVLVTPSQLYFHSPCPRGIDMTR